MCRALNSPKRRFPARADYISQGWFTCACLESYFGARFTGANCEQEVGLGLDILRLEIVT
jgi:hypothetical protein